MDSLALYYHIPFCRRKCVYCAFYSVPWAGEEDKDRYLRALIAQTESFPDSRPVSSVYFGGGTPNLFGAERIDAVLNTARKRYAVSGDCEITVEVNPGSVTREELQALFRSGVNRISVGMQSSDDQMLRFLGRQHAFSDVVACVDDARAAGFDNLSLDLLYALPGQTLEQFRQTLTDAVRLGPEHMSVYSLQIEEGTVLSKKCSELVFPSEEEEEAQYDLLCRMLKEAGYRHYEISSFARENRLSRHNMHYWECGEYIGFGPAAHSYWRGKRFSNTPDVRSYISAPLTSNDYSSAERISEEESMEERIMLGLRTDTGIPVRLVSRAKAEWLCRLGYLSLEGESCRMTEKGWRVSNAVIGQLIVQD